jgi:hypothetical protein
MKMKYEKPMVAVDQFKLSQAIAGCSISVGFTDSLCFLTSNEVPAATKNLAAMGYFTADGCGMIIDAGITFDKNGNPTNNYDGICIHTQVNGAITS